MATEIVENESPPVARGIADICWHLGGISPQTFYRLMKKSRRLRSIVGKDEQGTWVAVVADLIEYVRWRASKRQ